MDEANDKPEAVLLDKTEEGITTITLNRPHRRNAVDGPTSQKLMQAFLAFEDDPLQKVCVFTGSNDIFCAGGDLQELAKHSGSSASALSGVRSVDGRSRGPMGPSRLVIKKPVICAIAGYAVAGGLELSLLADMRVVEEDAVLGVFCRRFGVPLIDGGTIRIQAIIGLGRALDLILTGRPISAAEALTMGLVSRVVPKGKAFEEAMNIARDLIKFPQNCMNVDRTSCYYAAYEARSLQDAFSFEFENGIKVIATESIPGAVKFAKGSGRHGKL